jgi:molybdenum cofactor biosynthesis enzyme MoaA
MKEYNHELKLSSLAFFEREYMHGSKSVVIIKCLKTDKEKLSFLTKNNYEIISVENSYYKLEKELTEKKSFRISLTENCNYRCFFCHEEGMEMSQHRKEKDLEEIYILALKAIERGFLDITFTGGEPLIKKKWVIELINRFNKLEVKPDLTIVTNGVFIDDKLLDTVEKYRGNLKFNFSMHHTDREKYLSIVLPKDNRNTNYDIVTENIIKISERNIPIKLNFVILNGINNSEKDLISILDYASKHKVDGVKFLEFLVTDKLLDLYKYYFTLDSVYAMLKEDLSFTHENLRTKYYKYRDSGLVVELSHCTCGVGCSKCILAKDVTVTSELKYFPCFFRSEKGYSLEDNIDESLENGEKIIQGFSKKYGDKTPFKVSNIEYSSEVSNYNYVATKETTENLLKLKTMRLKRTRTFEERFYSKSSEKGIIKVYKNTYDHNYHEVVKKVSISGNKVISSFVFGREKRIITDLEKYEEYLGIIGNPLKIIGNWKIDYYDLDGIEISVGKVEGNNNTYIVSDKALDLDVFSDLEKLESLIEIDAYKLI